MPPFASFVLSARAFAPSLPSREFREQFHHPKEVFSVLLILGGDVVARALAQLAGGRLTPVTFSFGWVAYGVSAVVSAVGENKFMPQPDTSCVVINGKNGYTRSNTSWVIGRLVRDYESWMHTAIKEQVDRMIDAKWTFDKTTENARHHNAGDGDDLKDVPKPKVASLCVSVYEATGAAGNPTRDAIYWAGFGITVAQLGIASIPCGLYGDWGVLMVTFAGILLSFVTGSLPQWRSEKWAGRKESDKKIILTRGNGSQHAIVILGNKVGLDLEDLAAVGNNTDNSASLTTRYITIVLAGFWILLLITAAGLDQNNWFLLLVGAVGILQNILAAGGRRKPGAMGIPLDYVRVFGEVKVMKTLYKVEEEYPGVGHSMIETFFPGGRLFPDEKAKWRKLNSKYFTELTTPKDVTKPEKSHSEAENLGEISAILGKVY